jgi:hypothetical protein
MGQPEARQSLRAPQMVKKFSQAMLIYYGLKALDQALDGERSFMRRRSQPKPGFRSSIAGAGGLRRRGVGYR